MRVCDMCGEKLTVETVFRCRFETLMVVESVHHFCPQCKEKVEKFIKFQTFRNKKDGAEE